MPIKQIVKQALASAEGSLYPRFKETFTKLEKAEKAAADKASKAAAAERAKKSNFATDRTIPDRYSYYE